MRISVYLLVAVMGVFFTACSPSPDEVAAKIAQGQELSESDIEVMCDYIKDGCDHAISLMDDYAEVEVRATAKSNNNPSLGFFVGIMELLESIGIADDPEECHARAIEGMRNLDKDYPYFFLFGHVIYSYPGESMPRKIYQDEEVVSKILMMTGYPEAYKTSMTDAWRSPLTGFSNYEG